MTGSSRQWRLVRRPRGLPTRSDFQLVSAPLPQPSASQVLVRNTWLSVDPAMRTRMRDDIGAQSHNRLPPMQGYDLNTPLAGQALGLVEVVGTDVTTLHEGDLVRHGSGWRDAAVVDAAATTKVSQWLDRPQLHLSALGVPGFTAYVGTKEVARIAPGDGVFVSAAGGAVGSLAAQMARLLGAGTVVGSSGSNEKARWLLENAGLDAVVNYKAPDLAARLRRAAPDGIDVYFDNVGGPQLELALDWLNPGGRVAMCGMISTYNDESSAPGPSNLMHVIRKRLVLRGFIVGDHQHLWPEFANVVGAWLDEGRLVVAETVMDGLDAAMDAFLGLLIGANTGKMLIRL